MMNKRLAVISCLAAGAVAKTAPVFPESYTAVMEVEIPYFGLKMPYRVTTEGTSGEQVMEYYDGLERDFHLTEGTYKVAHNNSVPICMANPTPHASSSNSTTKLTPTAMFPNMTQYTYEGEAFVAGIKVDKWVSRVKEGTTGSMNEKLEFYYDPLLKKPVKWHMHSRYRIVSSHTDVWIVNYISVKAKADKDDLSLPELCTKKPTIMSKPLVSSGRALFQRGSVAGEAYASEFDVFVARYNKVYASAEEKATRGQIFEDNLAMINRLNEEHAGVATFKPNQFMDMTVEEVLQTRGGHRASDRPQGSAHKSTSSEIPKNLDWRTKAPQSINKVRDQAFCGSCWAFSLVASLESAYFMNSRKQIHLPEQFVVDCAWSASVAACDGGDSAQGAATIKELYGGFVPSQASYGGYLAVDGMCRKPDESSTDGLVITDWVSIPTRDEKAMLDAISQVPNVAIAINVVPEMVYYDSGILNVKSCEQVSPDHLDHAVNVVGYGTDEETGLDYYIVRNSWSTHWGDKGYFKVVRGNRDCGVTTDSGYPRITIPTGPKLAMAASDVVV